MKHSDAEQQKNVPSDAPRDPLRVETPWAEFALGLCRFYMKEPGYLEFVELNPAAQVGLGVGSQKVPFTLQPQHLLEGDRPTFAASLAQARHTNTVWRWQGTVCLSDTIRHLEITAQPSPAESAPLLWDGMVRVLPSPAAAESLPSVADVRSGLSDRLFRNFPGIAYRCRNDADWSMEFVSEGCLKLTGYTPDELLQNQKISYVTLIHPEDRKAVWEMVQAAIALQQPYQLIYRILDITGQEKWVWECGVPIFAANNSLEALEGFIIDITTQKRLDALRQKSITELQQAQAQLVQSEKLASLGQLVAGIAHEINNPVSFISGNLVPADEYIQDLLGLIQRYETQYPDPSPAITQYAEDIELGFLKEDLPRLVNSMRLGADRIQQIVRSLRNFSRLGDSAMGLANIHDGLDSTLLILQNRIKNGHYNHAIQVIKSYGDLPLVECYFGQLNQVFMNILTNAIDALEEKEQQLAAALPAGAELTWLPQIHVTTLAIAPDQVAIYIADNGPGIPPEIGDRLFEPFFTTKPIGKGTGLGMSISYQIVTEKHRGTLQCLSTPGEGTKFIIQLPTRQPSASAVLAP